MRMKTILKLLAVAGALCVVACNKPDGNGQTDETSTVVTDSDFVGTWVIPGEDGGYTLELKADGSYTATTQWGDEDPQVSTGTWSYKDGKFESDLADEAELLGEGGAMAFIWNDEESEIRSFALYFKKGATVKSPSLTDGRWDAPRWGYKPESYTEHEDYWCSLIVDGSNLDVYVLAWGFHMKGTYTQDGGFLKYNVTNIWQGIYRDAYSWGWSAVGPPTEAYEDGWDYTVPNMNPETFEVKYPWTIEEGNPLENDVISDMPFVITADGKFAYGSLYGIDAWFYKR